MGHDYSVHHLPVHRGLVPAVEQTSLVNLAGNLLGFHSVPGTGEDIDDGFFDLHRLFNLRVDLVQII